MDNIEPIRLCYLNNSFRCLNNTAHISTTFFHSHIFLQYLNNVTKTTLLNGSESSNMCINTLKRLDLQLQNNQFKLYDKH